MQTRCLFHIKTSWLQSLSVAFVILSGQKHTFVFQNETKLSCLASLVRNIESVHMVSILPKFLCFSIAGSSFPDVHTQKCQQGVSSRVKTVQIWPLILEFLIQWSRRLQIQGCVLAILA